MRVTSVPFSNGTEGEAWMDKWCAYCVHDHGAHDDTYDDTCRVILEAMTADHDKFDAGEAWVAPDKPGYLPSRMICTLFEPCHKGDCGGDPGAEARAERVAEVMSFWIGRRRK